MFELPLGVTGFLVDQPDSEVLARRDAFISWTRAVASGIGSGLLELTPTEPRSSFDAVLLEGIGRWVLHNRFVPLVGVLYGAPEPGSSWAVSGEWVDLAIPAHAANWGPQVLAADVLNAPLSGPLDHLGLGAKEQADRYKPETVGNVVFNYWT